MRKTRPFTVWIKNRGEWGIHETFKTIEAAMERARREHDNGWTVAITEEVTHVEYQGDPTVSEIRDAFNAMRKFMATPLADELERRLDARAARTA